MDVCDRAAKQVDYLNKQLEAELAKVQELKKELENFRKKAKLQQEQASRLVCDWLCTYVHTHTHIVPYDVIIMEVDSNLNPDRKTKYMCTCDATTHAHVRMHTHTC